MNNKGKAKIVIISVFCCLIAVLIIGYAVINGLMAKYSLGSVFSYGRSASDAINLLKKRIQPPKEIDFEELYYNLNESVLATKEKYSNEFYKFYFYIEDEYAQPDSENSYKIKIYDSKAKREIYIKQPSSYYVNRMYDNWEIKIGNADTLCSWIINIESIDTSILKKGEMYEASGYLNVEADGEDFEHFYYITFNFDYPIIDIIDD